MARLDMADHFASEAVWDLSKMSGGAGKWPPPGVSPFEDLQEDAASTAVPSALPTPAGPSSAMIPCDLGDLGYLADLETLCDADDGTAGGHFASTPPSSPLDVADFGLLVGCLPALPHRRFQSHMTSRQAAGCCGGGGAPRTPPNSPASACIGAIIEASASSPASAGRSGAATWPASSAELSSLPRTPPNSPRDVAFDLGREPAILEGLDEAAVVVEQVHRSRLHKVIELLFSPDNLRRDWQLRCRMDHFGWVPVVDVLRLLELRGLAANPADVRAAGRLSGVLQLSGDTRRLRARDPDIWAVYTSPLVEPSWPPHLAGGAHHFEPEAPDVAAAGPISHRRQLRDRRPGHRSRVLCPGHGDGGVYIGRGLSYVADSGIVGWARK